MVDLHGLTGWEALDNALKKVFSFQTFDEAVHFVNEVAKIANKHNHHPDILIQYNKVTLSLTTHDAASTVTEKDAAVAKDVEEIA